MTDQITHMASSSENLENLIEITEIYDMFKKYVDLKYLKKARKKTRESIVFPSENKGILQSPKSFSINEIEKYKRYQSLPCIFASLAISTNSSSSSGSKIYSPEECQFIFKNFSILFLRNFSEGGSRTSEENPQIHIKNIIQHYLNCFISSQTLMSMLTFPFNNSKWIDMKTFLQSIEAIHMDPPDKNSFFYKEPSNTSRKNFTMQKLLFFFKLTEFCGEKNLKKEKLQIAISMALKKTKRGRDCEIVADWIFERMNLAAKVKKDSITFDEFYRIMKIDK
ncbi:unnamed protein product [Blepharisma stoltei]|uniref:Uncharacterized protein n=1 Tax=Blepharisma stoltei TaxID=1481888 RepID=A0AAU9JTV9_9CILI|nr:unnamed protein product [Blepharisma stoltei]